MKCEVCKKEIELHNSVVCSDKCGEARKKIFEITDKYFPTYGCDNCWGDLCQGCSQKCKNERGARFKLSKDLWDLIHLIFHK